MSTKNTLTIWFGKLMVKTLHLLGRDAGNAPGLVLWELNKDCLKAFKVDCSFEGAGSNSVVGKIGTGCMWPRALKRSCVLQCRFDCN